MMRALEAQRQIRLVEAVSYAFGSMSEDRGRMFIQRLQATAARAEHQLEESMKPAQVASPAELAAAIPGMQVVLEEGPQAKAQKAAAEPEEPPGDMSEGGE
jgi:hypothetical protein